MSADPPILPTIREVLGAARDRLAEERPGAAAHLDAGRWALLLKGWRGQFAVANRRLGEEAAAARLGSATGQALGELAASNYDTPPTTGATRSVGEVTLVRVVVHGGPSLAGATITVPDATDYASLVVLLAAISSSLANGAIGHIKSVFDSGTALGAHLLSDSSAAPAIIGAVGIGDLADTAALFKAACNRHMANQRVDTGATLAIHRNADTTNIITYPDFEPEDGAVSFVSATLAEQEAMYAFANAIKAGHNAHVIEQSLPGTIRRGTPFRLAAVPSASPPVDGGQYVAALDAYVRTDANAATVLVEAVQTGAATNLPAWSSGGPALSVAIGASLFDTFTASALSAAGGGPGQPDETLRGAARAGWTGTVGPTPDALLHGALRAAGVVKAPLLEDLSTGRAVVYPVDASWAQSDRWLAQIEAALRLGSGPDADDERLGFGCRLTMGAVVNRVVRLELEVKLRDARYLADTEALTVAIRAALRAYFDDRLGWWTWSLAGIRAACSVVDRVRVVSCPVVLVRGSDGLAITEPATPAAGDTLTHWWFADSAAEIGYVTP